MSTMKINKKEINKQKIYLLMIIRKKFNEEIDHFIFNYLMRGKDVDIGLIKECIDECFDHFMIDAEELDKAQSEDEKCK